MLKYLLHRAGFHDGAIAQHDRVLGDGPDEGEVVGDEEHGQVAFALEPAKLFDDDRLHGHVEGGGHLVADQQVRLDDESARNGNALPFAAGKLVRVTGQEVAAQ